MTGLSFGLAVVLVPWINSENNSYFTWREKKRLLKMKQDEQDKIERKLER